MEMLYVYAHVYVFINTHMQNELKGRGGGNITDQYIHKTHYIPKMECLTHATSYALRHV